MASAVMRSAASTREGSVRPAMPEIGRVASGGAVRVAVSGVAGGG